MNNHINYIEFYANDIPAIKQFYSSVFGWEFNDYGASYTSFTNGGLAGGFQLIDDEIVNGALIVLYHDDIKAIRDKVIENGGRISEDIFNFPGGQRFQFFDPSGNELAVWSEKEE